MYQYLSLPIVTAIDKALEATLNVLVRTARRALGQAAGLADYEVIGPNVPYGCAVVVGGNGLVQRQNGPSTLIGVSTKTGVAPAGTRIGVKSVGYAECRFAVGQSPVAGQCFFPDLNGEFVMGGPVKAPEVFEAGIVTKVPAGYGETTQIVECLLLLPKCVVEFEPPEV